MKPPLAGVDVGAGGQEEPADLEVPAGGRTVERLDVHLVVGHGVHAGSRLEQDPRRLGLAEERREMECREPVGGAGRGGRRILVESRAQPVDIAERRRLEDVQLRVGLQQCVGHRPVEAVAGEHERRDAMEVARGRQLGLRGDQLGDPGRVASVDRGDQVRFRRHEPSYPAPAAADGSGAVTSYGRYSDADANRRGVRCGSRARSRSSPAAAAGWAAWPPSCSPPRAPGSWSPSTTRRPAAETVDLVRAAGGQATFVSADVSKEADAKAMVDHAVATYGRLDCLYNNAGIMPEADHSVTDTDVATWDAVMAVNVRGVFLGCKYAIPAMIDGGGGSIINIASFVAILGCSVPQDAYTASKGAVLSLTRSLAVQFGPHGVRTNAICPGPVETPLLMDWLVKDEAAKQLRLARNPTGRFGKPEEIVHMAVYLASDESRWTNGASLVVDGGITVNYF